MRTRYHHSTLANFLQTWSSQAGGEVANCCFGKLLCVCFGDGGSHKRYSIFGRIHIAGKIIVLLVMFGNCWSIVEKRLGGERAGIVAACPSTPANIYPPCPQLDTLRRVMRIGIGSRGVLQALWPKSLAWTPTRWSPGCWPSPYEGWLPWSVEHHSSALGPYRSQLRALPKSSDPTPRLFPQKSQAVQKKDSAVVVVDGRQWRQVGGIAGSFDHGTSSFAFVAPTGGSATAFISRHLWFLRSVLHKSTRRNHKS